MNSLPIPIPNSRGAVFVLGRVVVVNAHSPDKSMSRQLCCLEFSYKTGSHCKGKGDYRVIGYFRARE